MMRLMSDSLRRHAAAVVLARVLGGVEWLDSEVAPWRLRLGPPRRVTREQVVAEQDVRCRVIGVKLG